MFDCENVGSALTRRAARWRTLRTRWSLDFWILGNVGRLVHERVS